jgi:hypothetical protein
VVSESEERQAIERVVQEFFAVFDNRGGRRPRLGVLHDICLPQCVIVKGGADGPVIYGLEAFIAPRAALLTGSELTEFHEQEVSGRTDLFAGVAQRCCVYRKSGVLYGEAFNARGVKVLQLVKTADGWRISAVAWEDERPGFEIPSLPDDRA